MAISGYGESSGGNIIMVKTAAYTATIGDNGKWISCVGATAAFDVTLPLISTLPLGWSLGIYPNQSVGFAARFRCVSPDKIYLPTATSAAGGAITQTGSGRNNGTTLQLVATGPNLWWWGIGYPYDWSATA